MPKGIRISEQKREIIKQRLFRGDKTSHIAREEGVSEPTVYNIKTKLGLLERKPVKKLEKDKEWIREMCLKAEIDDELLKEWDRVTGDYRRVGAKRREKIG